MQTRTVCALMSVGAAFSIAGSAMADLVTDWNQIALQTIRSNNTPPPAAARALAMMHTAVYDAVNSIDRTRVQYRTLVTPAGPASREAAVAVAACDVLSALYPSLAPTFIATANSQLATIPDVTARNNGANVGAQTASAMVSWRSTDGASTVVAPFTGGTAPGQWRPAADNPNNGALPQWPNVTPFAMTSGSQFRPGPPPALNSAEYATAFNEVKQLGRATGSTRTAEQSDIAKVWKAGANTVTPPGMWNQIAQQLASSQGLSISDNARLFAQLNVSTADAGIAAWDCKYAQPMWRPIDAIRLADTDGNAGTDPDAMWSPWIGPTPNHPTYTSGHSTFSRAAATALQRFFGTDALAFTVTNADDAPGVMRSFTSLDAAANEAGRSRIYGGIHFEFDNVAGQHCGMQVGNYVADNYFLVPTPGAAGVLALGGLLAARRRRA